MKFAYSSAGRLDDEIRENIKKVVKSCNICHKNGKCRSKPSVAIPNISDFNLIITLDLKKFGKKHVLWMDAQNLKQKVLKDKTADSLMNGIIEEMVL